MVVTWLSHDPLRLDCILCCPGGNGIYTAPVVRHLVVLLLLPQKVRTLASFPDKGSGNEASAYTYHPNLTSFPDSSAPEREIEIVQAERAWYFILCEHRVGGGKTLIARRCTRTLRTGKRAKVYSRQLTTHI